MSFRDFTLPSVQEKFKLAIRTSQLFAKVQPVPLSETMHRYFHDYQRLGLIIPTEKGRSEFLVAPMLAEVWRRGEDQISLYSGVEFNVDNELGLNGFCDFLLGTTSQFYYVEAPIMTVVEAKKDSISDGLGQCASEMVAVQRFNQNKGQPLDSVYGCITTGSLWHFLRLTDQILDIDMNEYQIAEADKILGILLHCCGVQIKQ